MASLPVRTRIGYALGSITTGTYGTVPGLILMPYLTDHLGVAAALAGFIAFAPRALDFVLNPIAGRISDNVGAAARRRPFLVWAGTLLALLFAAMFLGPTHPTSLAGLWVLVLALCSATAYAFFQVPFLAMAAEITDDYAERTRVMVWRVALLGVAILVAGGSSSLLVQRADGVAGYRMMAVVMAVLLMSGVVGVWFGTRGVRTVRHETATGRLRDQLAIIWRNRDARMLFSGFALQAVAAGMLLAGVLYVARHLVPSPGAATYAFICFVGPALVCAPLWRSVGLRWGKKRGFVHATVVMSVGLCCLFVSSTGSLSLVLIAAGITGAGYAGAQVFPLAMIPDIAAEDAKQTKENRVGLISGLWSGLELLGLALGPALLGLLLDAGGYVEGVQAIAMQPDSARWAIIIGVSIVPASFCLVSLVPITRYRLDDRLRALSAAQY